MELHPLPHPTGLPGRPTDDGLRCSGCAWGRTGRCLAAAPPEDDSGVPLAPDAVACALWEPPVACETCGACCREAFDAVPVEEDDPTRERHPDLVLVAEDGWLHLRRVPSPTGCGTRCVNLGGDGAASPWRCAIYEDRPTACRDLDRDTWNCRFARTRVGLSPAVRFPLHARSLEG